MSLATFGTDSPSRSLSSPSVRLAPPMHGSKLERRSSGAAFCALSTGGASLEEAGDLGGQVSHAGPDDVHAREHRLVRHAAVHQHRLGRSGRKVSLRREVVPDRCRGDVRCSGDSGRRRRPEAVAPIHIEGGGDDPGASRGVLFGSFPERVASRHGSSNVACDID